MDLEQKSRRQDSCAGISSQKIIEIQGVGFPIQPKPEKQRPPHDEAGDADGADRLYGRLTLLDRI